MPKTKKKPGKPRAPRARPHLVVTIPRALKDAVVARAQAQGEPVSAITEYALRDFLRDTDVLPAEEAP